MGNPDDAGAKIAGTQASLLIVRSSNGIAPSSLSVQCEAPSNTTIVVSANSNDFATITLGREDWTTLKLSESAFTGGSWTRIGLKVQTSPNYVLEVPVVQCAALKLQ
jgi:hypothetical protein